MFTMHCGRGSQNTRDLPVAYISRLSDLPRKFWRFAELFGNKPFTLPGHMVLNKLCWDANNAVGLPKQRNSYQSGPTYLFWLRYLRLSIIYSVPCDRIVQKAYFRKGHELIGTVWMSFEKFSENVQSILLVIFQIYVKTVEMYVMYLPNCSETMNLGLFSNLLVLYVYI